MTLQPLDLIDLRLEAMKFMNEARNTHPRIFTGHAVAHEHPHLAGVKNFSTITRLARLGNGNMTFLIYRYPLSWVHSITDNLQRWGSGRPSTKPFRRSTWERRFRAKSRIPLINLGSDFAGSGLVAMEYVPNYNLWDVLRNGTGSLRHEHIVEILRNTVTLVNGLHASGRTWGELIVNNIVLRDDTLEPVLCDTEVDYWPWVSLVTRRAHDFRDFIFSACGAYNTAPETKEFVAGELFRRIADRDTRVQLVAMCRKRRSLGQMIFWQGFSGSLSCSSRDYTLVRKAIVKTWEGM